MRTSCAPHAHLMRAGASGAEVYDVRYHPTVDIASPAATRASSNIDLSGRLSSGDVLRIGTECVPHAAVELVDVTPFAVRLQEEWGRDSGRGLPLWKMSCGCGKKPLVDELLMADKVSDRPCNVRREGGSSLVIGGPSRVILEGKACNPL